MLHLIWRAAPGQYGQMIKISTESGSPLGLHSHEYPELFWIDEGPCRHRINGHDEILARGDLVFIRARDRHQLVACPGNRFTMTNLELHPTLLRQLAKRHREAFGTWFDEKPRHPNKLALEPDRLEYLRQLAKEYSCRAPNLLNTEGFCLDLARLVIPERATVSTLPGCPEWLQNALLKAQSPAVFCEGPQGLYRAAGRSPEHVARLCREFVNKTPTEIIEHHRMVQAEHKLRLTSASITEIALECGYSTTAQFHRSFKKYFHKTPLVYRRWIRGAAR